ncbi:hypothetical protein RF11_00349 [Thelohanellus kitauei]|uniref:Uncharacterized protein n=1 Tax=Thelohanellus kitauei TaxID=669202 RepID=A0A0C2MQD0_THEKT|nr:hypothetical protein RF11_00349 [Thelohanellus kitauei]
MKYDPHRINELNVNGILGGFEIDMLTDKVSDVIVRVEIEYSAEVCRDMVKYSFIINNGILLLISFYVGTTEVERGDRMYTIRVRTIKFGMIFTVTTTKMIIYHNYVIQYEDKELKGFVGIRQKSRE